MPLYKTNIMKDRVDFYFPIDPKWSEKDLLSYYYKKVQTNEAIYGYDEHLTYLKKCKTVNAFIQRASQDISKYPIIYFLLMLVNGAYEKAKESNLNDDELLIFRFFNLEPWPPETMRKQYWYTFTAERNSFDTYFNI